VEAGIQRSIWEKNLLDTRIRGYDGTFEFVLVFGSCSLCSHFVYFRFASRRGVSSILNSYTNLRENSMTTQEVKRKLTAILSADVKGYSRLMGEDEEWTVRTLSAYREIIRSLIQQHRGRVVDAPGDNVLAEFASVVDAVQCSVEIQQVLRAKNAVLPENRRMEFRIGINLGDVIEEGEQIYGDGVNIAARLEGLADAGGICISESAYQQIENKLPLKYQYLGEHQVKNIARPVRAYRAQIEPEGVPEKKAKPKQWQKATIGLVVAVIVVAASVAIWKFYIRPTVPLEVASKEKMAFPLPDAPSIAVLPFVNMSGDPKQEFLSDGITEEIITALSKVPRLFVISRQSTFSYKGKPVNVKQVSEELGVQYVLEGSVQRSADRIRINAQLIDALTGHHLWAERYERDLKDLFVLQDEITIKILTGVRVKLTEGGEILRAEKYAEKYYKGKQGLDCYLKLTEAMGFWARWNIEDNNMARRMIEEAIAICPENPMGYAYLGWVYHHDSMLDNTKSPRETIEKSMELAQKAVAMDDSIAEAHSLLCALYIRKKEYDKAIAEGERAVALNPGETFVLLNYARSLTVAGRPEEGIPLFQKAIRLNPFGPHQLYREFGHALRFAGRFEEAVSAYKKAIQLAPDNIYPHIFLAATYIQMGREKEARAEAAAALRIDPKFSVDNLAKGLSHKDQSVNDRTVDALRKAGLK
jgi:adenylate cyclase